MINRSLLKMIIDFELEEFNGFKKTISTNGFFCTKNRKNYFVSIHSFLPVEKCTNESLSISLQCNWNELIILKSKNSTLKYNVKFSNKLPHLGSILKNDSINATVREICFFNFAFLPNYPKTIYIKLKVENSNSIFPGTPFHDDQERLIGIVSFIEDGYIFLLPSYYIEKTFQKKNKLEIFDIDDEVLKINKNIVKKNMIYNPYIGYTIPLSSYMVLESNRSLEFELQGKYEKKIHKNPKVVEYKNNKLIPNKRKIMSKNNCYKINAGILHYIRILNPDDSKNLILALENIDNIYQSKIIITKNKITIK